ERAGVVLPPPESRGAGERDDRRAPVVADQRRERHFGFLLRTVLAGLGQHGDDRDEQPGSRERGQRGVLAASAVGVRGERGLDGWLGVTRVSRGPADAHAAIL